MSETITQTQPQQGEGQTPPADTQAVEPESFTNIPLGQTGPKGKKKKQPRRILHFSDGILEEYSTDEEEETLPPQPSVDPKTLSWLPWCWHYVVVMSSNTLSAADFCGEKLAWFFGITSPKYQYAIDEYYRLKEEEEKEKAKMDKEIAEVSAIDIKVIEPKKDLSATPDVQLKY